MEENNYNKISKQRIVIVIIILSLLVLIPVILFIHSRINSATINLLVAPESSDIHIDNHKVTNGKIGVTPGKHTVTAKKDGFTEQTITVEVASSEETQAFIILESNDKSTENWYKNHPEDQKIVEQISSQEYDEESTAYTDNNPIIKYLPFETMNYRLDYGSCEASSFCIFVDTRPADYDSIVGIIKQLTDDPARYSYVFKNYENPFKNLKTANTETISNAASISASDETDAKNFLSNALKNYKVFVNPLSMVDNYFIGTFSYRINDYPDINTYHFIIQKNQNGVWEFISTPQLIPTYIENKNIPQEVVKKVNEL